MNEKYKDRGLTGLANIGNSCYLNSCMQILSHTYEFNEFIDSKDYKKFIKSNEDGKILEEWVSLLNLMWSENCTIAPHGFVNSVKHVSMLKERHLFAGNEQNDIQEFLLFIIECFHNALHRSVDMRITGSVKNERDKLATECYKMMKQMYKNEYSEIVTLFYGIHISAIYSTKTNEILSMRPEPFSVLSLSLPNKKTICLNDCLDLYCIQEELIDENAWYNESTGKKENVKRGIIFWSLPNVLIIDLKRWSVIDGNKNNVTVKCPLHDLNLSKYIKGYNSDKYIYDLFGVCNHFGSSYGGHYSSFVKNANNKWYDFNDTNVTQINENNIISSNSYCLFYRKKK
tara:strand:- start:899 stop:1927 length:1029 start_codon:yes stop_codon:yes gene_type:complete